MGIQMKISNSAVSMDQIRFEGLFFGYEGQGLILENVDFDFPLDQMVWVKASSGAGRSTLLQILAGLLMPTQGHYLINDQDVADMSFEEFLPYRLNIGYGFDYGGLINNRTLFENLILPLEYHRLLPRVEAMEYVTEQLKYFEILKFKDLRPSLVPGRVRKLLCLVRAILLEPQMLLLDDPSVGLHEEILLKFFDRVQKLRDEKKLRHIFISSFDEKLMSLLDHTEIFVDTCNIYKEPSVGEKKAVHL